MQVIVYICNMKILEGLNSIQLHIPHMQTHTGSAYTELTWISVILCIADTDILSRNAADMCQNVGEASEAIGKWFNSRRRTTTDAQTGAGCSSLTLN